jgi:predicted ferric reductase
MLMKIRNLIEQSLFLGRDKPSSSRIFSYIMMAVIFMLGLTHIAIEIGNAAIQWKTSQVYVPSWQSISIIAMWLAHQLTLLGIYKSAEINVTGLKKSDDSSNVQPINENGSQNL